MDGEAPERVCRGEDAEGMTASDKPLFGDLLKRYRVAAGFSQEALAEAARLSARAISDLERGARRAPRRDTVALLADALSLAGEQRHAFEGSVIRRRGPVALTSAPGQVVSYAALPTPPTPLVDRHTEPLSPFRGAQQARRRAPRARILLLGLGAAVLALVMGIAGVLATHRHTATPADPVAKAAGGLFVPLTGPTLGHTLRGPFLAFYQRYGGATVFGRPRTESFVEGDVTRQYTDRFLLEGRGGVVTTAPLGHLLTAGQVFTRVARPAGHPTRQLYFPTTGHILADQFLTYWQTHHGSVVLGAPISELIMEKNDDGTGATYQLQWCEKGRLEFHSEQMLSRYQVMLGLLGVAALRQRGWLPSSG